MFLSVILPVFILVVTGAGRGVAANPCNTTLTCTEVGYFPRCESFCDTQYFTCDVVGEQATLDTCPGELVFDLDPTHPYCVLFSECPATACSPSLDTCDGYGTYPLCPYCQALFMLCPAANTMPVIGRCDDGMVYNPIPSHPGCVPASECPCADESC